MTRLAATNPAERLTLENCGPCAPLYGHWPGDVVAERLRNVLAVPATPVRLTTTPAALPSAGTLSAPIPIPVTLTSIAAPGPRMPCALHTGVGDLLLVSHTRTGAIGWNSPVTVVGGAGSKYPSTSARTLTA